VPLRIHHEGLILDDDGVMVEGDATLNISIYDAAEGGQLLWTEEHDVVVVMGYYTVLLGESADLSGLFGPEARYLGVSMGDRPEIVPRQRVASVPYSLVADNVVGDITPRSITVGGRQVIDESGDWVGPVASGESVLSTLLEVDGSGSGLDADLLDGFDSTQFMRADGDTGTTGDLSVHGVLSAAVPIGANDAATKAYVDAVVGGGGLCPAGHAVSGHGEDGSIRCADVLPPPYVVQVDPGGGSPGGGTAVTLTGGNFQQDARVFLGDTEAAQVEVIDGETITAVSARAAASLADRGEDVTVVNPNGRVGTLPEGFAYSLDIDGDGADNLDDCKPLDPTVFPDNEADDLCDGKDNNCDGEVDEDYEDGECATGLLGVCAVGESQCNDGVASCVQLEQASDEVCDRQDNDCDGEKDEGLEDCVAWGDPSFVREIVLDSWSTNTESNFHPQSLTVDPATGGLAFMMQGTRRIDRTNLAGVRSTTVPTGYHHSTGLAADETHFFFSDYTGNSGGYDLFRIAHNGAGGVVRISNGRVAYGGFPLVVRGDTMWRANDSNTYNWDNLRTIRVSNKATPDSVTSSFNIGVGRGIGDLCHDSEALWMLGNTRSRNAAIDLYKLDATNGALLAQHTGLRTCSNSIPSGLACTDDDAGTLYVFCYSEISSPRSSLVVFER